jgi:hypothetical protein
MNYIVGPKLLGEHRKDYSMVLKGVKRLSRFTPLYDKFLNASQVDLTPLF